MAKYDESLFEETKMTFGEHLEELRTVLVRGLVGLVGGFLIGLLVANHVVNFIETPLISALEKHYGEVAKTKLEEHYPGGVPKELAQMATEEGFIYEEIYIEREQLAQLAATSSAEPESAEPESATSEPATSEPAKSKSAKTEPVEQESPKTKKAEGKPAETGRNWQSLIKQQLPPPSSDLLKTRIWRPSRARLTTLSPHEAFMIWLKAGFVAGLIIASPYIFHQIWLFIAAGLYPHEKRYVHIFLPFSLTLFLGGAAMAFFFVFGPVLNFLFGFSRSLGIDPDLRISEVISFVLFLPLGFGIAFQLPLVMLLLNRIGIFGVDSYLGKWRIAILVIFCISMLLTPADPISMMLMAGPLTGLYFLGVGLCKWMPRGRNPFDEAYEP